MSLALQIKFVLLFALMGLFFTTTVLAQQPSVSLSQAGNDAVGVASVQVILSGGGEFSRPGRSRAPRQHHSGPEDEKKSAA